MYPLLAYAALVNGLAVMAGTGAVASAAWIIHLLNKRRFRVIDWAAMEYLLESQRKNRRRIQIEQLILLLIRTLLVLLLALAVARPFASAVASTIFGSAPIDRVVVVDDSYSVTQRIGAGSVFDEIKKGARAIAQRTTGVQTYSLLHLSDPANTDVEFFISPTRVKEPDKFSKEQVDPHMPSDGTSRLAEALQRALNISEAGKENLNKQIYLLTDLQESDWRDPVSQGRRGDVAKELKAIKDAGYALVIADMAPRDKDTARVVEANNLAITQLEVTDRNIVSGRTTRFRVVVRNYGSDDADRVQLTPVIDGRKLPAIQMSVPAGAAIPETFEYIFEKAGSHRVAVSIPKDTLPVDDTRYLSVAVRASVNVLIVDGDPKIKRSQTESVFLELALNPDALLPASDRSVRYILPKIVTRDQFSDEDLSGYDAVALANVSSLGGPGTDAKQVARLEQFVRSGGGVLVFVGDKVRVDWYNKMLWKKGKGLLPGKLSAADGAVDKWGEAKFLHVLAPNHPMFRTQSGTGSDKPLGIVPVFRHMPCEPETKSRIVKAPSQTRGEPLPTQISAATVLVEYEGANRPAMIEQGFGAGRVILVTTTCDGAWTIWPRLPSFLIAAQRMISHVANTVRGEQNVTVGKQFAVCLPPKFYGGKFFYQTPAFPAVPKRALSVRTVEDQIWAYGPPTCRAGFATLEMIKGDVKAEKMYLGASPDCQQESDLSHISEKQLRSLYPNELGGDNVSFLVGSGSLGEVSAMEAKSEFWVVLVIIAVGLMLIETFCAWKFAHHIK